MRKTFSEVTTQILFENNKSSLFLGDIGVYGFRKVLSELNQRAFNFGILEQAMVSAAAGFAEAGMHPFISTIAPFIVNRAYEQIKLDFGYQELDATFVTVGASFDYAQLGATHYCPEDVNLLLNIPKMDIYIPGSEAEVRFSLLNSVGSGLSYVRLSENKHDFNIDFLGTQQLKHEPSKFGILFIGPSLRHFSSLKDKLKSNIYYSNKISSLADFDFSCLERLLIITDFYQDSVVSLIHYQNPNLLIRNIEPRKNFYRFYGTRDQALSSLGCGFDDVAGQVGMFESA